MSKYSDIEIETAKNLMAHGYNWLVRTASGKLCAHAVKPGRVDGTWWSGWSALGSEHVCSYVPIFKDIHPLDKEPTSLESIVHPSVLDDAEKRYLRGVVRPFSDAELYIMKHHESLRNVEDIIIGYKSDVLDERFYFRLPPFKAGTMYKDMEPDRKYSLEELGL